MTKKKVSAKTKKPSKSTRTGRPTAAQTDDAREQLMKAAIVLFAKKGFDGTSVKDIAGKAGVNVSLVSYHFDGKEGLYKTCLEQFGKNRLAASERMLQSPQTRDEARLRFEMFIDDMMIWFEEEPDLCKIVQRESDMGFPIARDVFESTFLKVFYTFIAFVKAGQTRSFLRSDFDPMIAAGLYFGGLIEMVKKDDMTKKVFGVSIQDSAYRKKLKSQVCAMFFDGLGQQGAKR